MYRVHLPRSSACKAYWSSLMSSARGTPAEANDPSTSQRLFTRMASVSTCKECVAASGTGRTASAAAQAPASASTSSCPVAGDPMNSSNNMPSNLMGGTATPSGAGGGAALSAQRQASTIPMVSAGGTLPPHQQPGQQVWQYPSEQMFFNAMKRKGWDPNAKDMQTVVAIHNTVNEHAWHQVLAYEALHASDCPVPRLKKFMGRPSELSPKARLLNFVGFALPFDRHDWVVDRCGHEVRYIIDFYNGAPQPGVPAAMFVDARPALDSFGALWDRLHMQTRWITSGRWLSMDT